MSETEPKVGEGKAEEWECPLDPSHPLERLAFIVSDAQISVLVTQQQRRTDLPQAHLKRVCVDTDWGRMARSHSENPVRQAEPDQLAYVMYTSGSTGQPKGVMIEHRQVTALLSGFEQIAPGTASRTGTAVCLFGFDVSVWEFFSILCYGGTLHVIDLATLADPEAFVGYLGRHRVTNAYIPPGLLPDIVDCLEQAPDNASLKRVLVGVEPIPQALLQRLQACSHDLQIVNGYGPTETTICATLFPFQTAIEPDRPTPIGARIPGYELYLLDQTLQPVPIGVQGELYVGGAGVARGYLNRPDLTAAQFIPNPFSPTPDERLYKTGDLARYLPAPYATDKNLEFMGRIDDQVKLRGHRIELGEIEIVLRQHAAVREAALQVREDRPNDKRLVAYIVPHWQPAPSPQDLRSSLEAKLPSYMIPAAFIMLDHLPRTANGKVDWRALPPPAPTHSALTNPVTPPRTAPEEIMAAIWQRILGLDAVSIHDNFFDLGGHSLQAVQLVSALATALQLELSVTTLFLHPTIATLAEAIKGDPTSPPDSVPGPIVPTSHLTSSCQRTPLQPSSALTVFERRPLLPLFEAGELAPVDAAALAYLPNSLLDQMRLDRYTVLQDWCHHRPSVLSTLEMPWGRIALIALPCLGTELYHDTSAITALTCEAIAMSKRIGARVVSLTGLLPSATDYGRRIDTAMAGQADMPRVSTGHATTTAAVVLTIRQLLQTGGRHLSRERVGFLGLGSIGIASLRLMLHCLPHPDELILCDIYRKRSALEHLQQILLEDDQFQGTIRLLESRPDVPADFYDASLIVGATNAPHLLDISRVQPGAMIVDDSAPHCFNPASAIQRWQAQPDILFTEGGAVRSPHPIREVRYLPQTAEQTLTVEQLDAIFVRHNPYEIMGCTLSSLLTDRFAQLEPTIGPVDHQTCQHHHEMLNQLGFQAATLHCNSYVLASDARDLFRSQFENSL